VPEVRDGAGAKDGHHPCRPEEDDTELRDMRRRFWIGAALTMPVFIVAMAHLVPAWRHAEWAVSEVSRWGQFLLSTPVVLWAGGRSSCAAGVRCGTEA